MSHRPDWLCPNPRCRAVLGVRLSGRELRLTAASVVPERGVGWFLVRCRSCGHGRRWWGRISG